MMEANETRDVIVIGAGPVGLSLALGLARAGVDVLVLERETGTAEHSRAPAIWPRTQEILDELGILDRFLDVGLTLPRVELWDADRGRTLLRLPVAELAGETPHPRLLIVPQSTTEWLLREAVEATETAGIRFGAEVRTVESTEGGVEVRWRPTVSRAEADEQTVRARFVAGCDGARSVVRHMLGASFDGITYTLEAALADIEVDGADRLPFPRLTTRPELAVAIRMDDHLWRLILPYFPGQGERTLDERVRQATEHLFPTGVTWRPVWRSEFRLHRRVSSCWKDGRIVLAGDAAHLNSPVGGEGMNAGIADAAALVTALREAVVADDPAPLEGYAQRRQRAIEGGVNRLTDFLTRILMAGRGRLVRPIFRGIDLLLRLLPPLRRRLLQRLALLPPSGSGRRRSSQ